MQPIFEEIQSYKGKLYKSELFLNSDYTNISPITQVHAVCFLDENTVVFQKFKNGGFGNLGRGFEKDENISEVLKRELIEEGQLELISWVAFGYERISRLDNPHQYDFFLRTVAKVKLIVLPICDPCDKSIGRIIVSYRNAASKLGWGEKGRLLLENARKTYFKFNK